ncbi:MAG: shikimate kinase [Spirochaetales bacterium]|nr:shikimate kinase [Spirochaetales bacterium]
MKKNLAFIGARGAGKSKISRKLGKATGRTVLSTDMLISYEADGKSIPDLVSEEGWQKFREREYDLLCKLAQMSGVIFDCGGGILVDTDGTQEFYSERKAGILRGCAHIILIHRPQSWLLGRSQDPSRPALSDQTEYRTILERRLPWLQKTADFVLDMDQFTIETAVELLQQKYSTVLGF